MDENKRYLVHVRFGYDDPKYIREVGSKVLDAMKRISSGVVCPAYTTQDGTTMGLLVSTRLQAWQIKERFISSGDVDTRKSGYDPDRRGGAIFSNEDKVLILELAEEFSEIGFGTANGWLSKSSR